MKQKTMNPFIFHCDPGHGWLAVPVWLLKSLHCDQDISTFSYRGLNDCMVEIAYLEEDIDAATFRTAYEATFHKTLEYVEAFTNDYSFIRELPHYK